MTARATPGPWAIAAAGAVALAVAMGVGRFAFTPLLPLMLADGSLDLDGASWLASANYLGYLAGALACMARPWFVARIPGLPSLSEASAIRGGLLATAGLTLGMAAPWPAAWPALRFAAGVASAVVFVYTSGWCLTQLALRQAASVGGAMYTGPGVGIVASGLLVGALGALGKGLPNLGIGPGLAATGWAVFAVLALGLTALAWRTYGAASPTVNSAGGTTASAAATPPNAANAQHAGIGPGHAAAAAAQGPRHSTELALLALAYGLAGLGYIVTATFLPVIARGAMPGSPWLDVFWPLFGGGIVVGALSATRLSVAGRLYGPLGLAYLVQALGIGIGLWWPHEAGFALGSLLLGLPFTTITYLAMQEARRLRPAHTASAIGLLTALYGLGMIVGPPLATALVRTASSGAADFTLPLQLAMGALLLGAAMHGAMARRYGMF